MFDGRLWSTGYDAASQAVGFVSVDFIEMFRFACKDAGERDNLPHLLTISTCILDTASGKGRYH